MVSLRDWEGSTILGVGVNRATNIQLALDWCKKSYKLNKLKAPPGAVFVEIRTPPRQDAILNPHPGGCGNKIPGEVTRVLKITSDQTVYAFTYR